MNQVAAEASRLRGLLEDFLRLQQFEMDGGFTNRWIDEEMAHMTDDSHLDPTNLNLKVQNHKMVHDEIFSKRDRIQVLVTYVAITCCVVAQKKSRNFGVYF